MRSSNGFTQRLELTVRDPGLPCLVDGLICGLGLVLAIKAIGAAAWWPALIGVPVGALFWRRSLTDARQRGPDRLILTADGRWLVRCSRARPQSAELGAGWLAGRYCGLLLITDHGRRWRVYLSASRIGPDSWRRLRVRLRLPQPAGLT